VRNYTLNNDRRENTFIPADVFIIMAEISIGRLKAARVIQWKERVLVDREILVPEK
jgi:hypothetical protein